MTVSLDFPNGFEPPRYLSVFEQLHRNAVVARQINHAKNAALQSHALALTKYEAALPRAIREDAARKNR